MRLPRTGWQLMLTRFIKTQLIIFSIASIVGVSVMALVYIQAPALLEINRLVVKMELPSTGGLYKFSNVTYRGWGQQGHRGARHPERRGGDAVAANLTKDPADLQANVLSVSAVGEQYVDLLPRTDSALSRGRLGYPGEGHQAPHRPSGRCWIR